MKIAAILLMLAGWILVLAAIVLLGSLPPRTAFVLAGIAVEILAVVLLARAESPITRGKRA